MVLGYHMIEIVQLDWPCRRMTCMEFIYWLVVSTRLKNMKVNWDDYSQYMEKNMFQTTNQTQSHHGLE